MCERLRLSLRSVIRPNGIRLLLLVLVEFDSKISRIVLGRALEKLLLKMCTFRFALYQCIPCILSVWWLVNSFKFSALCFNHMIHRKQNSKYLEKNPDVVSHNAILLLLLCGHCRHEWNQKNYRAYVYLSTYLRKCPQSLCNFTFLIFYKFDSICLAFWSKLRMVSCQPPVNDMNIVWVFLEIDHR